MSQKPVASGNSASGNTDSLSKGLQLHQAGELEQAAQQYQKILRVDPRHADALHLLGVCDLQRGQRESAVARIGQAIAVNGRNAVYHTNLGAAFESLGKLEDAVRSYRHALKINPQHADACFNLGIALGGLNRADEAEQAYRDALKIQPQHVEALNNLGNLLKARNRLRDAADCYEKALSARPGFATSLFNLGTVRQMQGRDEEAVTCYSAALVSNPQYVEAHDHLGLIHRSRGDLARAAECHQRAVSINPTFLPAWLHLGSLLLAMQRLDEATATFARVTACLNAGDDATTTLVVAALRDLARAQAEANRWPAARETLQTMLSLHPHCAESHFDMGHVLRGLGELEAAAQVIERGLTLAPGSASGLNNLGTVREMQGQPEEALKCFDQAIAANAELAEAHYNRANVLRVLGKPEAALAGYRQALLIQPELASAHNNLGTLLQAEGQLDDACDCYQQAIDCRPNFAAAHYNLGSVRQTRGATELAEASYQQAVRHDPNYADAWNNLGTLSTLENRWDEGEQRFRRALAIIPTHADASLNLGRVLKSQGNLEEARECFENALAVRPSNLLKIHLATLLSPIYQSTEELLTARLQFQESVDRLVREGVALDPAHEILPNNFYLPYQGLNDRDLQQQFARLYPTVDCSHSSATGSSQINRLRIGVLSKHLKAHTIGRLMQGTIAGLSRDQFEVVVLAIGHGPADDMARSIRDCADEYVALPDQLAAARSRIAAARLDILFFCDLGMDPLSFSLAFTRFAPVQCVTWGHPVTSGIPTVDYFISSALVEPEDAESHYSERLVQLAGLPTCYRRPQLPAVLKSRTELGLDEQAHLYICPQSLFKLHPDFDGLLHEILTQDPLGQLILMEGAYPDWTASLKRRFGRTLPDVLGRVRFVPGLSHADFLNLLAVCDVMLDPLHFGGGNTTYEALSAGLPIVTLPGAFMRGRCTLACYQQMGIRDGVAQNTTEYVQLALRLGTDPAYRAMVRERIQRQSPALFDDADTLRELETFFVDAVTAAREGRVWSPRVSAASETIVLSASDEQPSDRPLSEILKTCTCPACGHHVAVPFYDGGRQPLTTLAWPRSVEEAQGMARLPHTFRRCVDCGHIYNSDFDYAHVPYSEKPNLMFNRGLVWTEHLSHVRDLILEHLGPAPTVVEVGCGDGHLLRGLAKARPAGRYIGFDPSGAIDDGGGLIIGRRELFLPDKHLAELRPDLIVSRHVLEHLMNPLGFVQALAFAASWENVDTQLLIEVPCVDQVFSAGRTVDFFYEHNSHFTSTSLRRLLLRCATDVQLIERGYNGEVVFGLARFRRQSEQVALAAEALAFRDRAELCRATVREDLAKLHASGRKVAIWGGTGKASAFMNQYGVDAGRFPLVVDSDADKAGTFVPGTGQEIRFRDVLHTSPVDVILIATQWRAHDIALEIQRQGIRYEAILIEHHGRLIDYFKDAHPYGKKAA